MAMDMPGIRTELRGMRIRSGGLVALAMTMLGAACTTERGYVTGQSWQRQECMKLADAQDRARCMESTAMSYDEYLRASRQGRK